MTRDRHQAAVGEPRRPASWNLRTGIANVSILFGFFALAFVVAGGADGARLAPAVVIALGGVCGAAVYLGRPCPLLLRVMSLAAAVLTVGGMVALGFVVSSS